ncbi:MAG: 50S ribosomal protein L3 [Anaerolineae bacterium]|nr:50S ribosomal protein L3 [Anaerolineae bacterium]
MMKSLIGVKVGMTQVIDDKGVVTPVTVIQAGPCYVTQVKTTAGDGYEAIQVGFGETKVRRLTKGEQGHLGLLKTDKKHSRRKKSADIKPVKHLREFRTKSAADYKVGQVLTVEQFQVGENVDVTGQSKGKGFAGGVKRYGFRGGPKTHGQSDRHRAPGSIGSNSGIAHTFKGLHMAGHMGDERHTSQSLEVMRIDPERHLIAVKGSVAGTKGGLVIIRDAAKG